MPPAHFSVTQVRAAAACPRILYFDHEHTRRHGLKQPSVTRIWKTGEGDETTACGTLLHAALDRLNKRAATDPAIRAAITGADDADALALELRRFVYLECVNREALFQKTAEQQAAFMAALGRYLAELAEILSHALKLGRPLDEVLDQMFGDRRRSVNVTFPVGAGNEAVHVSGILDYVFHDWRTGRNRILDYKLTPATQPNVDLFQVAIYALMHHVQHHTEPDVGVLYLHPRRAMVEMPWTRVHAERRTVGNLLASMREWIDYDETSETGLKPPGDPTYCDSCRWRGECVERLGPKDEGERLTLDIDRLAEPRPLAPSVTGAAPIPEDADALHLGALDPGGAAVTLPVAALPTHIAVVGAAGSGKTWLAKVIAEEAILRGVPVLAIDPQGDLVQLLRARSRDVFTDAERDRYDAFWRRVEPRVLTPGSSHGTRVCLNPLRLPAADELTAVEDPRRRAEERNGLLAAAAGNLVRLARAGGEVDSQQTFVLQVLRALCGGPGRPALGLADIVRVLREPEAAGLDDADDFVKKAERERLARKINGLLHGPAAGLFTGGAPINLDTLCTPSAPGKVPLNVVYLNALIDDDQKQFFVAALASEVYRWMVSTGSTGAARLLFYVDEARDYIPAGMRKPAAKEPLVRLFTQGRKYGVACLLCTQSPRSVDYNVFGNCSTKIIGRLESAQDAERVAEWFAVQGAAPAWLRGRAGAPMGTFVARWPGMPAELEGRTFKGRTLYSAHEGAWSPDRLEDEIRAGT